LVLTNGFLMKRRSIVKKVRKAEDIMALGLRS